MTIILLKIFLLIIFGVCVVKTHLEASKDYTDAHPIIVFGWLSGALIAATFVLIL